MMSMNMTSKISLAPALAALANGSIEGLPAAGEHVLGVSNQKVPHEDGDLERSGAVSVDGNQAAVSYDTPYAVVQHEDMTLRHDAGRTAKYLENAVNSEAQAVLEIIGTAIKKKMAG